MSRTYRAMRLDDAIRLIPPGDLFGEVHEAAQLDAYGVDSGVFVLDDGVPVEMLGTDGGEREDQTLGRAWAWVAPALQAAYDQGRHDAVIDRLDRLLAELRQDGAPTDKGEPHAH